MKGILLCERIYWICSSAGWREKVRAAGGPPSLPPLITTTGKSSSPHFPSFPTDPVSISVNIFVHFKMLLILGLLFLQHCSRFAALWTINDARWLMKCFLQSIFQPWCSTLTSRGYTCVIVANILLYLAATDCNGERTMAFPLNKQQCNDQTVSWNYSQWPCCPTSW